MLVQVVEGLVGVGDRGARREGGREGETIEGREGGRKYRREGGREKRWCSGKNLLIISIMPIIILIILIIPNCRVEKHRQQNTTLSFHHQPGIR